MSRECRGHETHAVSNKPCGHSLVPSQPYTLSPCPGGTCSQVVPVNSTDTHLHPGSEFPGRCEGLVLNQRGAAILFAGGPTSLLRDAAEWGDIWAELSPRSPPTSVSSWGCAAMLLFRRNLSLISYIATFTKIGSSCKTTKFTII